MSKWIAVNSKLPREGKVVNTKIDDENGCRNEQKLVRKGGLWHTPDMEMYVYYTPSHWLDESTIPAPQTSRTPIDIDAIFNFDNTELTGLIWNMTKWLGYFKVTMDTMERSDVESGVWISLWITVQDNIILHQPGNEYIIDGQRPDIVQRRLAEFLKQRHPKPNCKL